MSVQNRKKVDAEEFADRADARFRNGRFKDAFKNRMESLKKYTEDIGINKESIDYRSERYFLLARAQYREAILDGIKITSLGIEEERLEVKRRRSNLPNRLDGIIGIWREISNLYQKNNFGNNIDPVDLAIGAMEKKLKILEMNVSTKELDTSAILCEILSKLYIEKGESNKAIEYTKTAAKYWKQLSTECISNELMYDGAIYLVLAAENLGICGDIEDKKKFIRTADLISPGIVDIE